MQSIDQTFAALGDGTRMAIIAQLAERETSLSDLAKPFPMSQTAVSKHVGILADAGLVEISKRGRTRFCRLRPEPMESAENWLKDYRHFWHRNMDNLANFLSEEY